MKLPGELEPARRGSPGPAWRRLGSHLLAARVDEPAPAGSPAEPAPCAQSGLPATGTPTGVKPGLLAFICLSGIALAAICFFATVAGGLGWWPSGFVVLALLSLAGALLVAGTVPARSQAGLAVVAVVICDLLALAAGPLAADQAQGGPVVLALVLVMALYPANCLVLRRAAAAFCNGLLWASSLVAVLIEEGLPWRIARLAQDDSLIAGVMAASTCALAGLVLRGAVFARPAMAEPARPEVRAAVEAQGRLAAENLRLREKLARINRISIIDGLNATVSHELSQPVAASLLSAEAARRWLARRPADLHEAAQAIDDAIVQLRRAGAMATSVRHMGRRHPGGLREVSAGEVIAAAVGLMGPQIAAAGVRLCHDVAEPAQAARIMARGEELGQVLVNLLGNALESFGDGSGDREIRVGATRERAGWLTLSVTDNGCGIAPHELGRVFEAFHTTKANGLGLGLAICRDIAQSHGGRLEISSRVGAGSRVELHLPAHEADAG